MTDIQNRFYCEGTIKKFLLCNYNFVANDKTYCLAFELSPFDKALPNLMFVFIPSEDKTLRDRCLKIDSKLTKIGIEIKQLENCKLPSYELIKITVLANGENSETSQIETQFIKTSEDYLVSEEKPTQQLNKGMQIWKTKRSKRFKQALEMKPQQEKICRFVNFRNTVHHKVNGKFTHPKIEHLQGLQVKNRFYYIKNNQLERAMINKHGAGITKVHNGIPQWAHPLLIEKYENFLKNIDTTTAEKNTNADET